MRTVAAVVLVCVGTAGPARAYFSPLLPPGLELPPPVRSIIPPEVPTEGNPPSARPPEEPLPPTVGIEPPGGTTPPGAVPEPAAVVSAAAGLLAVTTLRRCRRSRLSPAR